MGSKPPAVEEGALARAAIRFTAWAERWFPDAFVFVAIAVVVVAVAALANGAPVQAVTKSFGDGFWSLITFTMQMAFVAIGGYVVASSPPARRLIHRMAEVPTTGRGAVGFVAAVSMIASLFNWGLSLIFGGLLARAIAERRDIRMDYRAAGAAAYLGLGATWALGLSPVAVDCGCYRSDRDLRHHRTLVGSHRRKCRNGGGYGCGRLREGGNPSAP